MVLAKIQYGLGNQLFQYAFARRLAIERNENLLIDKSWYEEFDESSGMTKRDFLLDQFNIPLEYVGQRKNRMSSVKKTMLLKLRRHYHRLYLQMTGNFEALPFFISGLDAVQEAAKIKRDIQVIGEWTNYRFYESIRAILLQEFSPKNEAVGVNKKLLEQIRLANSVFVHIRRGDYLTKRTHDLGGVCDLAYYKRAIEAIMSRVTNPVFYFFSDDMDWIKDNFAINTHNVLVDHNDSPVEDFRLMQNCKQAIISNSTFSWWAAWLIENESKTVIAPAVWSNADPEVSNRLIPLKWIRVGT